MRKASRALTRRWSGRAQIQHSSHAGVGETSFADFVACPILGTYLQRMALSWRGLDLPREGGRVSLVCSSGCGPGAPPVLFSVFYSVLWVYRRSSQLWNGKCVILVFWWLRSLYHAQLFLFLLMPICNGSCGGRGECAVPVFRWLRPFYYGQLFLFCGCQFVMGAVVERRIAQYPCLGGSAPFTMSSCFCFVGANL